MKGATACGAGHGPRLACARPASRRWAEPRRAGDACGVGERVPVSGGIASPRQETDRNIRKEYAKNDA
jgi:hypothetical protein